MNTVYRLGHQTRHHYWPYFLTMLIISCLVTTGVLLSRHIFQANTTLRQSTVVIKQTTADTVTPQHITNNMFAVDLPPSWQPTPNPHTPYTMYSWQGGRGTEDSARRVDIYIDNLPSNLAANHLLSVENDGDHLNVTGGVSDNCASFTDKSAPTGAVPAKWDGVNFLCDTANYERDVVVIGSAEGTNVITITGSTTGKHHILMTYTDNSANADYSIFIAIVKSFHIL